MPLESKLSQFMRSRNDDVGGPILLKPLPLIKPLPDDERTIIDKYLEMSSEKLAPMTTGRKKKDPGMKRYGEEMPRGQSHLQTLDPSMNYESFKQNRNSEVLNTLDGSRRKNLTTIQPNQRNSHLRTVDMIPPIGPPGSYSKRSVSPYSLPPISNN